MMYEIMQLKRSIESGILDANNMTDNYYDEFIKEETACIETAERIWKHFADVSVSEIDTCLASLEASLEQAKAQVAREALLAEIG